MDHRTKAVAPELASSIDCLAGGGESGAWARSLDWAKTPLGPVEQWSQALRSTASLVLHNHSAMLLWWGPEFVQIYNDAYRPVLGDKHFGLLRAVREDPNLASVPVILLSARAGEEARVEGLQAGADDYLVKPFSARDVSCAPGSRRTFSSGSCAPPRSSSARSSTACS